MAKRKRRQQKPREGTLALHLRPLAWSALLGAAVAAAFATPTYATPTYATPTYAAPPLPPNVPDAGSRPAPIGTLRLPGQIPPPTQTGPTVVPPSVTDPLARQIFAAQTQVATLGEQLLRLRQDQEKANADLAAAEQQLRVARDALSRAIEKADVAAGEALKDAAGLPPGTFGSDLHGLGTLSRLQKGEQAGANADAAAREVARAQADEQAAYLVHSTAAAAAQNAQTQFTTLEATYKAQEASLLHLRQQHADQLAIIEQQQDAAEQQLGAGFVGGDTVAGKAAHPRALAAVRFALAQLGKPYLWGAEGPDRYDCSGLMWAAYRSSGADYTLPRVAKDQYYGTRSRSVNRNALLPGDLLFFASGSDWTSIHHVGMYIGNGKMVHSPTTGDVVKVSTVWWSRFYAATRVFGEVPAPSTPSPKQSTPKPSPSKTPEPTKPPTPAPTPTPSSPTPTAPASDPAPSTEPPASSEPPASEPAPSGTAEPSATSDSATASATTTPGS